MSKNSKAYRASAAKIDKTTLYSPLRAVTLAKETASTKYDSTVDVAVSLGVDPRQADQLVRGTVNLPNGTGKTSRVLVFATGANADAAREAGADHVGSDDLVEKVADGWLDFDAVVATPDLMGKVGRLGRVLGPRNLMPNPKTGTVTMDVAKAVSDIKGGKIEFRVDRHANVHFIIGKASFTADQLAENYAAAFEEILRLKPASSKGRYVKKVTVSTTSGPGIGVDPVRAKDATPEAPAASKVAAAAASVSEPETVEAPAEDDSEA
jgi:large subunit ribosomal protein L1